MPEYEIFSLKELKTEKQTKILVGSYSCIKQVLLVE